jgi:uncharacterized Zn finger protein
MCKHVAAVLYGVGARLDHRPELLFRLRRVNEQELIATAGADVPLSRKGPAAGKVLEDTDLAGVFGVELAPATAPRKAAASKARRQPSAAAPEAAPPRGRKPKAGPSGVTAAPPPKRKSAPPRKKKTTRTAAQRKAASERMQRYWEERRRR